MLQESFNELLNIIVHTSFRHVEKPILLKSGIFSNYYVDMKMALSYPRARELIGEIIYYRISGMDLDAVGGPAISAYPIATAVSDAAYKDGKEIRALIVRKEQKERGLRKCVEGHVVLGDRALIVEDVVTSGDSTVLAIEKCRDEGIIVDDVIALVDRNESDGRQNIESKHVLFSSLFSLQELIDVYDEANSFSRRV